ncbi:perakine reductase-like [Rhodamnia argentea]|uniref:Perakine reductase-like n=1 Tax=Rhodamnia argentea TaxID=178133 RepID=A0A8B8PJ40_9MYRT|nr:perakine reductase-like [Rhodamnia argentea]
MADNRRRIPRAKLGTQGLEVSKLGFGCMGLTGVYNDPVPEEVGVSIIVEAFAKGVTFFDTSDAYGPKVNEILVGKALKKLPREEVQLASKFGVVKMEPGNLVVRGTPDYVRSCCEASLERLGVEYIDLYYVHRIDTSVPIEETMEELKKLVEEGKVKHVGLLEASPDTIRRAHVVHPITAIQMEWSLWTRDIEQEIVPLCRELGIGIVPYSPLGRGFFGGKGPNSFLERHLPRFQPDNLDKNKSFYAQIEKIAEKYDCIPPQLALAWVLHQGNDVVPIPGTTKTENLDKNIGSLRVKLTEEDVKEISGVIPIDEVAGSRINKHYACHSWKNANTPPRGGNFPA